MPTHIKDSLKNIFDKQYNNSWQATLLQNWNSIIGSLKNKVQIEKINNDSIVLVVSDACWMQELYLLSNLIINKINSKLDQPRIKNIRFKQSKIKNFESGTRNFKKSEINKPIKIKLTPVELASLEKIKDPQLSEALKNFLFKCQEK